MDIVVAHYFRAVAISNERKGQLLSFGKLRLQERSPMVIVAHCHHQISSTEHFLTIKNARAHTIVENVSALVGSRHNDGVVSAPVAIALFQGFDEFIARNDFDFCLRPNFDERKPFFIECFSRKFIALFVLCDRAKGIVLRC